MLELDLARTATSQHRRVRRVGPAVTLGVIAAVVGFAGSWIPSYWGDEAASVMSASRSLDSLVDELSTVDAVHGVYYALLHVWMDVFGSSEASTRLPSAIAVGLMVAGTVVLVREFAGARIAILAGIVCLVLPRTTYMATEARSYALASAAAVWVTVLLVRALRERSSKRWWALYTVAAAASIYLFLYVALLLVAHGLFVLLRHRPALARWAWAALGALVLTAPILFIAYAQRKQISFLARRDYATFDHVVRSEWFGSAAVAVLAWGLVLVAILGVVRAALGRTRARDERSTLGLLAVLWLVLPTAILLVGNALVEPMYNVRYLSLSTPAAAILVALGIATVAELAAPARRRLVGGGLAALLIALCVPVYLGQRLPFAKDGGSDLREVAEYVRDQAAPGDAVLFDQSTKPSRDPRLARDLYPADFAGLRDVALRTPFAETTGLWDSVYPNRDTWPLLGSSDVWAVELSDPTGTPDDIGYLVARHYEVESVQLINRTRVFHLVLE